MKAKKALASVIVDLGAVTKRTLGSGSSALPDGNHIGHRNAFGGIADS